MADIRQLTEKDEQLIVADYAMLNSYEAVANKWNISNRRVQRIIAKRKNSQEVISSIKNKIAYDTNNFIESIQPTIKEIMATYLAEILKPEKIAKTSPKDLAIVMGILQDKFGLTLEQATKSVHNSLDGLITKLKDEPKDKPNE
jgi:hypothetical protein